MRPVYIKWSLGFIVTTIAMVLLDALFLEKYFFKVKQFRIGKHGSKKHLTLLFLTDLHLVKHLWPHYKRLARKINTLRPYILLITGDIIDHSGDLRPAKQFFALLHKHIPKLAIAGNHDHKNSISIGALKNLLKQNNGYLLMNATKKLQVNGETLTITGIDDFIEGEADLAHALQGIGKEAHHLLLIHSPLQQETIQQELQKINDSRAAADQVHFAYILAGHNHGGQVRLGRYAPVLPEKSGNYLNGWYNHAHPYLYVSKGFGTSGVPFRFGARSEIILFKYGV